MITMARVRQVIMAIMFLAFIFGFLDSFFPVNFTRLHIFLFNVTTGGFIILFYTEGGKRISLAAGAYLLLSIIYSILAFKNLYLLTIPVSLILFIIVEIIRIKRFSFFPADFFRSRVPVSSKFHQASLLCLSMALLISTAVILNYQYYHWVHYEKLTLNVFFLGFSFPVSLITMSLMFHFIQEKKHRFSAIIENSIFWLINCGVIVFFIFIILEIFIAEIAAASILFTTVIILYCYFLKFGRNLQQKAFLISGMTFLLFTAITGLLYIPAKTVYTDRETIAALLLQLHASISLYGWNLSGLFVILRWNDFPLKLNSKIFILFHWIIIVFLVPLGKMHMVFAVTASLAYGGLLWIFFTNSRNVLSENPSLDGGG